MLTIAAGPWCDSRFRPDPRRAPPGNRVFLAFPLVTSTRRSRREHAHQHRSHRRAARRHRSPATAARLAPRGPGLLAGHRRADRPAQPLGLDLRGARRLLGVESLVGHRALPRPRVRHRPGREVPAHRRAGRAGRGAAAAVHAGGGPLRRTTLDDHQRTAAAGAGGADDGAAGARGVLRHPDGAGLPHRGRWRQLRLLDGEHQPVLPAAAQGPGARAQRRWRQPRAYPPCSWSAWRSSPPRAPRTPGWCRRSTCR